MGDTCPQLLQNSLFSCRMSIENVSKAVQSWIWSIHSTGTVKYIWVTKHLENFRGYAATFFFPLCSLLVCFRWHTICVHTVVGAILKSSFACIVLSHSSMLDILLTHFNTLNVTVCHLTLSQNVVKQLNSTHFTQSPFWGGQ